MYIGKQESKAVDRNKIGNDGYFSIADRDAAIGAGDAEDNKGPTSAV